ncbi:MAG: hypothetical protein L6V93_04455 [Clostridiales bacterium]|nr:MAG: hypothetical protein L6V93_04455 [Clostridiales bacterium]
MERAVNELMRIAKREKNGHARTDYSQRLGDRKKFESLGVKNRKFARRNAERRNACDTYARR